MTHVFLFVCFGMCFVGTSRLEARPPQVIQRLLELRPQMSLNSSDQMGQTALDHAVQGHQQVGYAGTMARKIQVPGKGINHQSIFVRYLVGGLEHVFFHKIFIIWDVILPIDFHIFQRGRSTTKQT